MIAFWKNKQTKFYDFWTRLKNKLLYVVRLFGCDFAIFVLTLTVKIESVKIWMN